MRYLIGALAVLTLSVQGAFGYWNERRYDGKNPNWVRADGVDGRLEIIDKYLPENPTVFEVGAKDGEDTVKLAKRWSGGKIISFEANPNQFPKYLEKAQMYPNMFGYNLAVNTYNGFTKFYLCWGTGGKDPIFEGASSLLEASKEQEVHYQGPVIDVPCVIFDDWCRNNSVANIDFMWLDLEGFEMQFLKSSPEILKTVQVIYTETNFYKFRKGTTQYHDLKSFLRKQGFEAIAHWYNEGLQGDAIFVRKSKLNEVGTD